MEYTLCKWADGHPALHGAGALYFTRAAAAARFNITSDSSGKETEAALY